MSTIILEDNLATILLSIRGPGEAKCPPDTSNAMPPALWTA
ncbi:MAG: hypothetical protein NTV11_09835 [Rhodocyclales bacterium]|nr:hypothetical protein [Rhodocyclales bacterium]